MTTSEIQSLLDAARSAERQGNYGEAERLAQQVLDATDPTNENDAINRAKALKLVGLVALRRGNASDALELFNSALVLCEIYSDAEEKANVMGNIGMVYTALANFTKALEYHTTALALSEGLPDKSRISVHLANIGIVYRSLCDYGTALSYFSRAIAIDEELGDKRGVARNLATIGIVFGDMSQYPKALENFTRALALSEEVGDKAAIANVLASIGKTYIDQSDLRKALEYISKALAIEEELGSRARMANSEGNIGIIQMQLSNFPQALKHITRSLTLYEELDNKEGVAMQLESLGNLHALLLEHTKALDYHTKALTLFEELGLKSRIQYVFSDLGNDYARLSEHTKALEHHSRALAIAEELGDKRGAAVHLGNIGSAQKDLGEFAQAEEYFLKALHLSEEIGAAWPRVHWLGGLGALYFEQRTTPSYATEAESYLKRAIDESTTLGAKQVACDASKISYQLFQEQQRWQDAFELQELHYRFKEEINVEEGRKLESMREHQREVELTRVRSTAELKATTGLLHRVLPQSIATRIIAGEQEIADYFPSVSILFADIVGFTSMSSEMPAIAVVRFLNNVFARFDEIIKRYNCEKIKTIGDGYMAIAGAPVECADHAERLAAAALEMQQPIMLPDDVQEHMPQRTRLGLRIGLHTGPIVAGVIGEERFVYDVYSDAVNLASRMESHGQAGRIHCSQEFAMHVQNRDGRDGKSSVFRFEERGEMEIKGKGMMRTYFLSAS